MRDNSEIHQLHSIRCGHETVSTNVYFIVHHLLNERFDISTLIHDIDVAVTTRKILNQFILIKIIDARPIKASEQLIDDVTVGTAVRQVSVNIFGYHHGAACSLKYRRISFDLISITALD
jgi:hypothetical protein